jgi:hypothetical protein
MDRFLFERFQLMSATKRYTIKIWIRSFSLTLLTGVVACSFVFTVLWMRTVIESNRVSIEKAYNTIQVTGDIITSGPSNISGAPKGPISETHIKQMLDTQLVESFVGLVDMRYDDLYILLDGLEEKFEFPPNTSIYKMPNKINVTTVNSPNTLMFILNDLNMLPDYSFEDLFKTYTLVNKDNLSFEIQNDAGINDIPIIASNIAMDIYDLKIGDKIRLDTEDRDLIKAYGKIVGTFSTLSRDYIYSQGKVVSSEVALFIYPYEALNHIEQTGLYFSELSFRFVPEKNRELMVQKETLKSSTSINASDLQKTELRVWDEQLREVVVPLEKTVQLLEILYPVVLGVSFIFSSALAYILTLRRILELSIFSVLGVKLTEIKRLLFTSYLSIVLLGMGTSLIIASVIIKELYSISVLSFFIIIGSYLVGTVIGLIVAITRISHNNPLEMLQVRE